MAKVSHILYRIKNVLFILFLVGAIGLIPNAFDMGFIGIAFLVTTAIYTVFTFCCYIKQDNNLNTNIIQNILGIFLYLYVYLIMAKYFDFIRNSFIINSFYFKINYVVAVFTMIGITINSILLLNNKK